MAVELNYRQASSADWNEMAELLRSANLPLDGAEAHLPNFVLAVRGEQLVGCAALENYGAVGLLRSVAVAESERGTGLGKELVRRVLAQAKANKIQSVVLLTETAGGFFPRSGFRAISRAEVPAPALASVEFQTVCPVSAMVMMVELGVELDVRQ